MFQDPSIGTTGQCCSLGRKHPDRESVDSGLAGGGPGWMVGFRTAQYIDNGIASIIPTDVAVATRGAKKDD